MPNPPGRPSPRRATHTGSLLLLLLLPACSPGPPSDTTPAPIGLSAEDSTAVAAADRAYAEAWLTNEADAVMATLGPDPVIVPSGMAAIAGADAIREFWFPPDAATTTVHRFDLDQAEIDGAGDLAYARGSFTLAFDYDGATYESAGTYVSILRHTGDGWRITRRSWNDHRRE